MRKVYLFGEINNERAEKFIAQLHELFEESRESITIFINSCGGSVTDALAIYDVIQNAPCEVFTIGLGKVHSSAITVLLSASRANRSSYPNTEFMSHDISWKSDGPRAFLKDRVDQLERTVDQLLAVYTRDSDLSREKARAFFFTDMADHYFNAEEAISMGFVSSIITRDTNHMRGPACAGISAAEVSAIGSEEMAAINLSQD